MRLAADASIGERVQDIMDRVGETPNVDIRQEVIDLCREVKFLAHQVDAVIAAQDGASARSVSTEEKK